MQERASGERRISTTTRAVLLAVGGLSWAAGGVATFASSAGASSAVLIVTGAAAAWIGLMGRWPEKISISGNEMSWPAVKDLVDDQIEGAQSAGDDPAAVQELVSLRERLDRLQFTGRAPEHPAVAYDSDVETALRRLRPSARISRSTRRSDRVADFVLQDDRGQIQVETKWRSNPSAPYAGSTLPDLLDGLKPDDRLLLIANTRNVQEVQAQVSRAMGERGRVVCWRGRWDDRYLEVALDELLPRGPSGA